MDLLLRHRAALFGILGMLLLTAAFHAPLRAAALIAGLASVASFLLIAWWVGPVNGRLHRVVQVDLVALVLLLAAGVVNLRQPGAS